MSGKNTILLAFFDHFIVFHHKVTIKVPLEFYKLIIHLLIQEANDC